MSVVIQKGIILKLPNYIFQISDKKVDTDKDL